MLFIAELRSASYSSSLYECVRLPSVLDWEADLRSVSKGILSRPQCVFHCSTASCWPHIPSLLTSDKRRCRGFSLAVRHSPHLCHFWRSQQTRSSFYMHLSQYTKPHLTRHTKLRLRDPRRWARGGCKHQPKSACFFLESPVAYLSFKEAKKNIASLTVSFKL